MDPLTSSRKHQPARFRARSPPGQATVPQLRLAPHRAQRGAARWRRRPAVPVAGCDRVPPVPTRGAGSAISRLISSRSVSVWPLTSRCRSTSASVAATRRSSSPVSAVVLVLTVADPSASDPLHLRSVGPCGLRVRAAAAISRGTRRRTRRGQIGRSSALVRTPGPGRSRSTLRERRADRSAASSVTGRGQPARVGRQRRLGPGPARANPDIVPSTATAVNGSRIGSAARPNRPERCGFEPDHHYRRRSSAGVGKLAALARAAQARQRERASRCSSRRSTTDCGHLPLGHLLSIWSRLARTLRDVLPVLHRTAPRVSSASASSGSTAGRRPARAGSLGPIQGLGRCPGGLTRSMASRSRRDRGDDVLRPASRH